MPQPSVDSKLNLECAFPKDPSRSLIPSVTDPMAAIRKIAANDPNKKLP